MENCVKEIGVFITTVQQKGWPRNQWFEVDDLGKVYIRVSKRPLCPVRHNAVDPPLLQMIDIASGEVAFGFWGAGICTDFLSRMEQLVLTEKKLPLYIENVMEERFQTFFLRNGYTEYSSVSGCVCFIKLPKE